MSSTLFISHGAPDIVIADTAASRFLKEFDGFENGLPRAIVVASAHFEAGRTLVTRDPRPETIHDFGGFDPRMYQMTYSAPGDRQLADEIVSGLNARGIDSAAIDNRGFDHGTWVPLKLMRPQADIPVVQISVNPRRDARWHYMLGEALAATLDDDVVVLGSGAFTHNLRAVFTPGGLAPRSSGSPEWVTEFEDWMADRIAEGDLERLLDYRTLAPHAVRNHPTEEHIAPLFVALGAAQGGQASLLHSSRDFGVISMNAYRFG